MTSIFTSVAFFSNDLLARQHYKKIQSTLETKECSI